MHHFIAETADVYGKVQLAEGSSVWYQAVLRGDNQMISVGKGSNIQDGTIVHVDQQAPVQIGNYVTVGHQCILHGCTIQNGVLVGMGTIVMNGSIIGENAMIGAGSLITEGMIIPSGTLALGRPAQVIRPLTPAEIAKNRKNAEAYMALAQKHAADLFPKQSGNIH